MDATEHPQPQTAPIAYDSETGEPVMPETAGDAPPRQELVVADSRTERSDQVADRLVEAAQRLKPVAIVAENTAAKAVDLSARGLARLSGYLERRRQERERSTDEMPTAD
jgi:hypothetical protein